MKTIAMFDGTEVDRVRKYAEEHLYRLPDDSFIPGTRPEYVAVVDVTIAPTVVGVLKQKLRVVFTHLEDQEEAERWRIASFSLLAGDFVDVEHPLPEGGVLSGRDLPAPSAVQAVCIGLGFRGGLYDWLVTHGDGGNEKVIMVHQRIEKEVASGARN